MTMSFRSLLLLTLVFSVIACGGPEERKAKYRTKAQEYFQSGNYPKARVALRNVLKIDPRDANAYFLFAQVEEKEKNWRNAVQLYQEVVQLVPDHAPALITLAKYYLEARLTEHVLESADKVLVKNPRHPQALALKIAAASLGDPGATVSSAEALAAEFPSEPDVSILLATLYAQQQRYREAESVLRRALAAHPNDLDLFNNLETVLVQAKDLNGAEVVARRMIEVDPTSYDHRLKLARLFDSVGAPQKAEGILRDAVTASPNSEERWLVLADFLMTRKDVRAAEQVLTQGIDQLPRSSKLQFGLADLYLRNGQEAKARERYASLVDEYRGKPVALEAKVKLAELDMLSGKQAEADLRLLEVLKENPRSTEGLLLSGRMALARRNGKDAVQAFRTVLHDQPELASAQFYLGQAYQLAGDTNLARESFERAVALYPGQVDARRSLAVLESQSGRHQQARARLDDLLRQRPDDLMALNMLMTLDLLTGNSTEAERTLARMQSVSRDSALVFMAEGRLRQTQGRLDQAAAAYERATAAEPNDPEPLLSLVKLDVARGQVAGARERLESLVRVRPNHLYGHGLLGEVLTLESRFKEADAHFQQATSLNPKWITPWLDWGSMWLGQKQYDQAVQVTRNGLTASPESEELYMLLASVHSASGVVDAAIAAYESSLRINPKNVLAANNLAVLLTDHKTDPQSLQRAFALSRDFEKEAPHPLFLDTLGWVRLKMGQQEEALRIMKTAVSKLPDVPTLNYHLGMAYFHTGKTSEARVFLSKALKSSESFQGRQEAEQVLSQIRG